MNLNFKSLFIFYIVVFGLCIVGLCADSEYQIIDIATQETRPIFLYDNGTTFSQGVAITTTAPVSVRDGDTSVNIDEQSSALVAIDPEHTMVHEGYAYRATAAKIDLADAATSYVSIDTGSGRHAHLKFKVNASGDALVAMSSTTVTTGGTLLNITTMNKVFSYPPVSQVRADATLSVDNDWSDDELLIGGEKNKATGGDVRSGFEWLLDENETYTMRLINIRGSATNVSVAIEWYERVIQ